MTEIQRGKATGAASAAGGRKAWVDALRAMAMIFVIFGHQVPGRTAYFVFTSPIKIPLFFMISGYVFNDSRTGFGAFFKNLLLKLVIPWFCLTLPFAVLKIPSQGFSVLTDTFLKLVAG